MAPPQGGRPQRHDFQQGSRRDHPLHLQGGEWPLVKEVQKVVDWFREHEKPDVVFLSTILLAALGCVVKRELNVPVYGFLQGEDSFLDTLLDEYRTEAMDLLSADVARLDGCIAPSRYFGAEMAKRFNLPEENVRFLPNGITLDGYSLPDTPPAKLSIGFLARLCPLKGLDLLVDAYLEIMKRGNHPELELRIAGGMTDDDAPYVEEQKEKIRAAGLDGQTTFLPNVDRDGKLAFLRDLTLFSVPSRYPEAFGLYVVEALAAGVPVVLPHSGAFPEIIEATEGGLLYQPEKTSALPDASRKPSRPSRGSPCHGPSWTRSGAERFSNKTLAVELVDLVKSLHPTVYLNLTCHAIRIYHDPFRRVRRNRSRRHHALYQFLSLDGSVRARVPSFPRAFRRLHHRRPTHRLAPRKDLLPLQATPPLRG